MEPLPAWNLAEDLDLELEEKPLPAGQPSTAEEVWPRPPAGVVPPAEPDPPPPPPPAMNSSAAISPLPPASHAASPLGQPALPPHLLMMTAEAHRRAGRLAEAIAALERLPDAADNPEAIWRLAYCHRRLGHPETALNLCAPARSRFPAHALLAGEYAWAVYAVGLKPALDVRDWMTVLTFADEMLAPGAGDVAARVAFFAAVEAARALNRWDLVLDWCRKVPAAQLSAQPRTWQGRSLPADRERWYLAAIRAHLALASWDEARRLALEAAASWPRRLDFPRWAAKALVGAGRLPEALQELDALVTAHRAPWYIWADLAETAFRHGEVERAWEAACRAALAPGEPSAKVNLFALMADLAERRQQPAEAALHVALALTLRQERGWPVPEPLQQAALRHGVTAAPASSDLVRQARAVWNHRPASDGEPPAGGPPPAAADPTAPPPAQPLGQRREGRLIHLNLDRDIAFLKPLTGGDAIFARARDLPEEGRHPEAILSFTVVEGFDRKKNRPALRAADLQLVKG
ncbi:MAG: hypothetical protein OZSIB_1609 [Candidatus Ozemobacter sibiricus]|jgi:tetratricopeptide (TPR) repeat protein|uniref:Tetratricopeptide repeat protein n=1 Tax=Candidatus Ozemobacter sibiricus TaxID=2268124 RepID=A0A367ZLE5_9BACT|nr:MAG: hypothetical protein OZSIB_1609 [Candidatus Ozemobacter sibiricus]